MNLLMHTTKERDDIIIERPIILPVSSYSSKVVFPPAYFFLPGDKGSWCSNANMGANVEMNDIEFIEAYNNRKR